MSRKTIDKARRYASGGALPKADKGDFRGSDPFRQIMRAAQDYWLSSSYADPRGSNRSEHAATRPTGGKTGRLDLLPDIWQGVQGFADGGGIGEDFDYRSMSPLDQLRARMPSNFPKVDADTAKANQIQNAKDLLSIVPGPGNIISAADAAGAAVGAKEEASAGNYGRAALRGGEAALSALGAVAGVPFGRLAKTATQGASSRTNMFAGPLAQTADHDALKRAQEMTTAGVNRDAIWTQTGWFQGRDGKWRFEIPDDTATMTKMADEVVRKGGSKSGYVEDFLKHDQLDDAYPGALMSKMMLKRGKGDGTYWDNDRLDIEPRWPAESKRITLHEMQHKIQRDEGFSPGASPTASRLDDYYRSSGEVEARNVESRMAMTPDERRAIAPWYTQDVDDAEQIVTAANGVPRRQQTFVPAGDSPKASIAKAWREHGVPNEDIFKGTGLSYDPGGNLRREIIDFPMKVDLSKAKPGTIFPLGDVVDHPELFKARPELRNQPVRITNRVNEQGHSTSRTNPDTGVFELSNATDAGGSLKGDLAKMLQYRISDESGFPASLRHRDQGAHLDQAMKLAAESGSPHAAEYVSILDKAKQEYFEKVMEGGRQNAGNFLQSHSAGNVESRHVRARATEPGDISGMYPWMRNPDYMRTVGHQKPARFGDMFPLPPESITKPDAMRNFLERWKKYGSGSGKDPAKFARGGVVQRARQQLAAGGLVGDTGGRTDAVPVKAAEGSYVIPADVVAALGEGNSMAGFKMLKGRFPGALGKGVKKPRLATGGAVDIIVSDGEFVVTPDDVAALGGGDLKYGHDVLDGFVLNTRKRNIEELSQLPGPKS